ncbi:ABC transporter substrate-binding protein [Verrucosispora sp. WMMD1129]|uniref:ABC transporter substrate-binding protein n=1 Tax=Verrucosispora sp. WMMD1129 TaxID=3016093 RepID=UPI00249BEC4B|nr:ABC transporter substrate-binding protein [Verrucosispora sp. WMMD1129]WFE47882.1 ABC transporter substrate-binding protein [Verrucosispora sp. WMMD1129]
MAISWIRAAVGVPVALSVALVSGCGGPPRDDGALGGTSIVIGAASEPDNLNPVLGYAPNGASKLFDGLVDRDADLSLRPALAAELPRVSTDGLTWTADLRPGVTFSDGQPVTAEDVVFTYEAVVAPASQSPIAADYEALESVRAVDTDTVEFRLRYPYQPWAQRLALGIVPKQALAGQDIRAAKFNRHPVGTGPYRLVDWRAGERMVLTANPDYYRGAPQVTDVTIVFAADDNVRAQRMAAGEFDAAALPPKLARTYEGRPGYRVVSSRSADYRGIGLPVDLPITATAQTRRAVNLAIDRQAMVDTILAGQGTPASSPVAPALAQWHVPSTAFAFDRAQAARLLDEAGWRPGPDGVRVKDGVRAELPVLYPGDDVLRKELAVAAASDISEIGIEARAESATFEQMLQRRTSTAGLWGGGDPYDPDSAAYTLLHSKYADTGGYVNMTRYRNAEVDAALDRGRQAGDADARVAAYHDFQRAYADDPGWAFLVFLNHTYVLREGWTGLRDQVEPHDHGLIHGPWWNLEEWTPAAAAVR